jgi:two-component system NtrC family sensor kinase
MHPLLKRQLRKSFHEGEGVPQDPAFEHFLQAVDAAYRAADDDRQQLERSLHLASDELYERNRRLESELEERKRLELELRLAEKMRAVGQLAAGIAHEINTPVQFIGDSLHFLHTAFAELMKRSTPPAHTDEDLAFIQAEIPQALDRCEQGSRRVAHIVRALKELAHPGTGEQQPADINAAIQNVLIVAANEFKYVADVDLSLEAGRQVSCHIGEIQQVLLNLVVNAAHAIADRVGQSGARGRIRIATREDSGDCIVSVQDDGAGIPDAVRDRIFEPFFTTKPVGKGTGQGLSIAHTLIVERHGGQIGFDSIVGQGTTFTFRLPIAGRRVAASARPQGVVAA